MGLKSFGTVTLNPDSLIREATSSFRVIAAFIQIFRAPIAADVSHGEVRRADIGLSVVNIGLHKNLVWEKLLANGKCRRVAVEEAGVAHRTPSAAIHSSFQNSIKSVSQAHFHAS